MSQMIRELSESLSDDLYQKIRVQLNTFINETNALLAAGDLLHEDRTALARERLAAFLRQPSVSMEVEDVVSPPVTRVVASVRRYVARSPWASVGVAAGVGVVAALWLKRQY